jgi:hypothetical protein
MQRPVTARVPAPTHDGAAVCWAAKRDPRAPIDSGRVEGDTGYPACAEGPFTVPYQIVGDEIVILALASRRPDYWARRR